MEESSDLVNELNYSSNQVKVIALNAEIGVLTKILDGISDKDSQPAQTFANEIDKKKEEILNLSLELAKSTSFLSKLNRHRTMENCICCPLRSL